jgi:hypothetical protein
MKPFIVESDDYHEFVSFQKAYKFAGKDLKYEELGFNYRKKVYVAIFFDKKPIELIKQWQIYLSKINNFEECEVPDATN